MDQRSDNRGEHSEKREDDTNGIHANGAEKIEHDHAVAPFADREHFDEAREIARHQRYVGSFQRNIGALAHSDADCCFRQRGGVVYTVADHRHFAAGAQQRLNFFHLLLGQQVPDRLINAQLATDGFRRVGAVTGQQDHTITLRFEIVDSFPGFGAKLVGQRHGTNDATVAPDQHGGFARAIVIVGFGKRIRPNWHAMLFEQRDVPTMMRVPDSSTTIPLPGE
jgi:hypothetical protein